MKFAYSCDIVRNNNPKSKRFGQYGIALTTSDSCAYINYQDGFSAYCNIKNFELVKHNVGTGAEIHPAHRRSGLTN